MPTIDVHWPQSTCYYKVSICHIDCVHFAACNLSIILIMKTKITIINVHYQKSFDLSVDYGYVHCQKGDILKTILQL